MIHAIGLMSGTSLDGLDICYAQFHQNKDGAWQFKILNAETVTYSEEWTERLKNAIHQSAEDFFELHSEYGIYLAETVSRFIKNHHLGRIDVIGSHGHTVFHQPHRKFTVQIGDGRAIKLINQIPVVYDFRSQDVLLGGNGAPLVPIGDELLFAKYDACLNLGGFSNISFKKEGQRIAFDICPVNIVLNHYANKLGKPYDDGGKFARTGSINPELLKNLNALEFYQKLPPKSLGFEWVEQHVFPLINDNRWENILATFCEHAATQIANVLNNYQLRNVLLTGGGTFNKYLIDLLKKKTNCEIVIPRKEIINFKEALIFGFMAVLRTKNEINILSSATGSAYDHSSGLLA